jgi:hypothetical protein
MDERVVNFAVADTLLAAIAARDYDAIARCFAAEAQFLVLTPKPQLREHTGPAEAARRFRRWLDQLDPFVVLAADSEVIADRVRIRYRFRGRDPDKGWQENEHTAYARIDRDGLIALLTLTCAGFRPLPDPA